MTQVSASKLREISHGNFGLPFHIAPSIKNFLDDLPLITVSTTAKKVEERSNKQEIQIPIEDHLLAVCPVNGKLYLVPDDMEVILDF